MTQSLPNEDASRPVKGDAKTILAASTLPAPVRELIGKLVRRTRLWKREKAAVAMELIAHFEDGMEAGRGVDELIVNFGDVKTAARLIRRGKRRNRPLWWQAQRRLVQLIAALLLVYIGLAVLLVARHPNPSVDYMAELNRPVLATPLADRAWPIYRDAWIKARLWELKDDALYLKDEDGKEGRSLRPGDAAWPEAAALLRQQKPLLDAMREGGLKPSLGWELKSGGFNAFTPEERTALTGSADLHAPPAASSRADQLMAQSLLSVLLPHLSRIRQTANLLAADMRLAASEGDAARVLASYRALIGMARQCIQTPIVVNQLVGLGMLALADETLLETNQRKPGSLSSCRVDLLHAMASAGPLMWKMAVAGERAMFLDMIQRVYSDNGKGDGTATLDGLRVMAAMPPLVAGSRGGIRDVSAAESLLLPAAVAVMASRRDVTEQADRMYSLAEEDAARPLWVKLHEPSRAETLGREWRASTLSNIRYALPAIMAPSLGRASMVFDRTRALHEAAMVAMALEAYRDKTGRYPATLAELVPHYLPAAPLDYSTGGPLRYKLVDGKPLLYGLGKDGVDDGGVWTDKKTRWPGVPDTGDWVLYPPQEQN